MLKVTKAVLKYFRDGKFRHELWVLLITLLIGTFLFSILEGWSLIDSFYFSTITLTTVGYGDLAPTTTLSKLATILYIMIGLGIMASFITKVGDIGRFGRRRI